MNMIGTSDLWKNFQENPIGFYKRVSGEMATEDTPTLSRVLEFASPTTHAGDADAFTRMMEHAGIVTNTNPLAGYYASPATRFLQNAGTRALMTEYCARQWRKVTHATRATLTSDGVPGSISNPYSDSLTPRWEQEVEPAIPLSELTALRTPITGKLYRAMYLEYDATQLRLYRVGEYASIPIAKIQHRDHTIELRKYGRGIGVSYEALADIRVDRLGYFIRQMAVQKEVDKVSAALDVIVNGDGNTDTAAATHNLTTLDSSAIAGTLTLKGWLAFKMKFVSPYILTTALMQEAVALQLALLNTGSANVPLVASSLGGLGTGLSTINQFADGVRYGWTSDAPSLKIVGFDRRFALEEVFQIGMEISEMERVITNQSETMTMTEIQAFAVLSPNAALILNVNA